MIMEIMDYCQTALRRRAGRVAQKYRQSCAVPALPGPPIACSASIRPARGLCATIVSACSRTGRTLPAAAPFRCPGPACAAIASGIRPPIDDVVTAFDYRFPDRPARRTGSSSPRTWRPGPTWARRWRARSACAPRPGSRRRLSRPRRRRLRERGLQSGAGAGATRGVAARRWPSTPGRSRRSATRRRRRGWTGPARRRNLRGAFAVRRRRGGAARGRGGRRDDDRGDPGGAGRRAREAGAARAFRGGWSRARPSRPGGIEAMVDVVLVNPEIPPNAGQRDPAVRQHGDAAAPGRAAGLLAGRPAAAARGPRLPRDGQRDRPPRLGRLRGGAGGPAAPRLHDAGRDAARRGGISRATTSSSSGRRPPG